MRWQCYYLLLLLIQLLPLLQSFLQIQRTPSIIRRGRETGKCSLRAISHIQDFTSCILHVKDIPLVKEKYQAISVGMPRILTPNNDDGEWKLWFQMRDKTIPDNVFKLSTGRIMHATSRNGINDFKVHENSPILNPSKDSGDWFYFDSEHVGLGDIIQAGSKIQTKFQSNSNVYLMYTFGGNGDKLTLPTANADGSENVVVGTKMEIGLAVSQDGIHWSRVEGSSAFASIIEKGKSPEDYDGMFIGWPSVLEVNGEYFLYYHTFNRNTNRYTICLAVSSDGLLRWEKKGPVFDGNPNDPSAFDANGATRRHIIRLPDGSFRMYYEGVCSTGKHAIGVAISRNGYDWKKVSDQPIFNAASSISSWDAGGVSSPHVVYLPDVKRWRMYYVGYPAQFINQEGNSVLPSRTLLEYNGIGIAESQDETGLSFHRVEV